MADLFKILQYDNTASLADNLISYESHTPTAGPTRLIVPRYGSFYESGLNVYGVAEDNSFVALNKGMDYICVELNEAQTKKAGQAVYHAVVVFGVEEYTTFRVTYRAVGGPDSASAPAVRSVYNNLSNLQGSVAYADILFKPKEFPTNPHLHWLSDWYGFTPLITAVNDIRAAFAIGHEPFHEKLIGQFQLKLRLSKERIDEALGSTHLIEELASIEEDVQYVHAKLLEVRQTLNNSTADTELSAAIIDTAESLNEVVGRRYGGDVHCAALSYINQQRTSSGLSLVDVPPRISGLKLRLDASHSSCAYNSGTQTMAWRDRANSARIFRASGPTSPTRLTSTSPFDVASVHFGAGQYLVQDVSNGSVPLHLEAPFTLIYVIKFEPGSGNAALFKNSAGDEVRINAQDNKRAFTFIPSTGTIPVKSVNQMTTTLKPFIGVVNIEDTADVTKSQIRGWGVDDSTYDVYGISETVFEPERVVADLDVIGNSAASTSNYHIAEILVYNRRLSNIELETLEFYLKMRHGGYGTNRVPNPDFLSGYFGFSTDYFETAIMGTSRGAFLLSTDPYGTVFPDNPAYGQAADPIYADPVLGNAAITMYLSGTSAGRQIIWRGTFTLEPGWWYRLKFKAVYGATNPPIFRLKVDGVDLEAQRIMSDQQAQAEVSFTFKPASPTTLLELYDEHLLNVGDTFGITGIELVRDMFAQL